MVIENRIVVIYESDDMSDKILSKYNIGLSVIVRSKDIDVWDLVIILL